MKYILLTKGKKAIVDDEDFLELSKFKWHFSNGYAMRREKGFSKEDRKLVRMHRQVMGFPVGKVCDHKNGNPLDNRKKNLRMTDHRMNLANCKIRKTNRAGFKGVTFDPITKRFRAKIMNRHIGRYDTPQEAHEAYKIEAVKIYGEFARFK